MTEEQETAISWAKKYRELIDKKFREKTIPQLLEVLSSLKNVDDVYYDVQVQDDLDWLETNSEPWKHEDGTDWEQYIEHHWKDRLDDLTSVASEICIAGEVLDARIQYLCNKVKQLTTESGDDVKSYSASGRELVMQLGGAVTAVKTLVGTPIEDPHGHYGNGQMPEWVSLVRYVATTFPVD